MRTKIDFFNTIRKSKVFGSASTILMDTSEIFARYRGEKDCEVIINGTGSIEISNAPYPVKELLMYLYEASDIKMPNSFCNMRWRTKEYSGDARGLLSAPWNRTLNMLIAGEVIMSVQYVHGKILGEYGIETIPHDKILKFVAEPKAGLGFILLNPQRHNRDVWATYGEDGHAVDLSHSVLFWCEDCYMTVPNSTVRYVLNVPQAEISLSKLKKSVTVNADDVISFFNEKAGKNFTESLEKIVIGYSQEDRGVLIYGEYPDGSRD